MLVVSKLVDSSIAANNNGDWTGEFDRIPGILTPTSEPAFILVRTDEENTSSGLSWVFIMYVPEDAKVRDKMIYASTRNLLLRELGEIRFPYTLYVTSVKELSQEGYRKHCLALATEAPLTEREQELQRIRREEVNLSRNSGSNLSLAALSASSGAGGNSASGGLQLFPLTEEAKVAIVDFKAGKADFICLGIVVISKDDTKISLTARSGSFEDASEANGLIPKDSPAYVIFRHKKKHVVFLYYCPQGCKVSLRMIHSSSKASFINLLQTEHGVNLDKKVRYSPSTRF